MKSRMEAVSIRLFPYVKNGEIIFMVLENYLHLYENITI